LAKTGEEKVINIARRTNVFAFYNLMPFAL